MWLSGRQILESHVNISVLSSILIHMTTSLFNQFLPAPAKSFNLNTNSNDVDYQVSTKQVLEVIRRHPEGISLKEIVDEIVPNFNHSQNTKTPFKKAIDPLCLRDEVRFTYKETARGQVRRIKYYPVRPSKRVLLKAMFDLMISA